MEFVLFPKLDDYIDFDAIDVFLTLRVQGENPVTIVLASIYCTLNHCYGKDKKKLTYLNKCNSPSPITDARCKTREN